MPIPIVSTDLTSPQTATTVTATPTPFPARTKQAAGVINGTRTDVTTTQFTDKIVITITQEGKLGHWVHVPLESGDPGLSSRTRRRQNPIEDEDEDLEPGADLLPLPHLTATTILGVGAPERDVTLGQLLGTQVGTALTVRNPNESRLLVLGIGLKKSSGDMPREEFIALVGLCVGCL